MTDVFPAELRALKQWLVWKLEPNQNGKKPRKVPYYVSGSRRTGTQGSDDDRAALADYHTAAAAGASGAYTGLGFAFLPGDGLVGIDLDGITDDAERTARAQRIIDACQSYTEHSPSGNGVHIIGRGETETFKSNPLGIEVFSGSQFFTMTGEPYGQPRELATISADTISKLRKTVKKQAHDEAAPVVHVPQPATGDKIHDALAYVSPDCGYDDWLRIGMALHAELGPSGLTVWDSWSARSAKYPGSSEVASHWRSFKAGAGVTIATLYGLAKDAGWTPRYDGRRDVGAPLDSPHGWPAPEPLLSKVEPLPYPCDALPDVLRGAVEEVQAFVQAPLPLVAGCALSALSVAIQAHHDVKRAERLTGPSSLFLLTIAESGERKSTADSFFMQAIKDYEKSERQKAEPLIQQYNADFKAWEAKRNGVTDAIRADAKKAKGTEKLERDLGELEASQPIPPRYPRLLYGDVTPEELARKLAKVWPSGGVVSAEAGIVFGSHGMGKDSAMRNLALLNTLWDGAALKIDRKTSESFVVEGARLTVALQVQESALREFFENTGELARGTGFLARFLVSWPESTRGTRFFSEPPLNWPRLAAFNHRITRLLNTPAPITDDGGLSPSMLTPAPEAKQAWVVFHDAIEKELREGGELRDVSDVAAKIADNASRLAALFHAFEGEAGAIGPETFERAARVAFWHLSESRRFFGELAIPRELADACRLDEWLIRYCQRNGTHIVPRREIQRCGPNGLREKKRLDAAILELVNLRRLRDVTDGKRRDLYVNPALLGDAA